MHIVFIHKRGCGASLLLIVASVAVNDIAHPSAHTPQRMRPCGMPHAGTHAYKFKYKYSHGRGPSRPRMNCASPPQTSQLSLKGQRELLDRRTALHRYRDEMLPPPEMLYPSGAHIQITGAIWARRALILFILRSVPWDRARSIRPCIIQKFSLLSPRLGHDLASLALRLSHREGNTVRCEL